MNSVRVGVEHPPAVSLDHVTAGWMLGRPVLAGVSLEIEADGVTRVLGRNGTGKSTLVELLSGYLRPWEGTVTVAGVDAASPRARERRRVVRTQPRLFGAMTAGDHLRFFARTVRVPEESLFDLAGRLGLGPHLDENARALSSGTAKKLWFVVCSAGQPDVLVLDEPFNAVDDPGVAVMVESLMAHRAHGAVVLVSHGLPEGLTVDHTVCLAPAELP